MEDNDNQLYQPITTTKIHQKLDQFTQLYILRRWPGNDIIDTFFYLYLFNKYKSHCLVKYEGVGSGRALGLQLQITPMSKRDRQVYQTHLNMIATQLANCIKRGVTSIIIPLYLKTTIGGHANVLIYRKEDSVIEHFEPHGQKFYSEDERIPILINERLEEFMAILNKILRKERLRPVTLVTADIVCPTVFGLQLIESKYTKTTNRRLWLLFCLEYVFY